MSCINCPVLALRLCGMSAQLNCADYSPRFCNVCGGEVGQLWSRARAGFYKGQFLCTDQAAQKVCKMRRTIGSCCSKRSLPPILENILLLPLDLAELIAQMLDFGPREIACASRSMLRIRFVPLPLPSSVTDCILSFLRTDFM